MDIGGSIHGEFETEWMEVGDPNSDKRFYKITLFFVQTGDIDMKVEWCVDWDDRITVGSTHVTVKADEATIWGMEEDDGSKATWDDEGGRKWDKRRVVSKVIDLEEAHGKCIRFRFSTGVREPIASSEDTEPYLGMPTLTLDPSTGLGSADAGVLSGSVVTGSYAGDGGAEWTPVAGHRLDDPWIKTDTNRPRYEPWRLVGWHLFLEDHGVRSRGTAQSRTDEIISEAE